MVLAAVLAGAGSGSAAAQGAAGTEADLSAQKALVDRYCVSCHNEAVVEGRDQPSSPLVAQLRAAGLSLDTLDLTEVDEHADQWEKVVRKLRGGLMPPAGRPRPDAERLWGGLKMTSMRPGPGPQSPDGRRRFID